MAEWGVELAKDLVTELGIGIPGAEFDHLTDMGNARWLVRLHGGDFKHCWPCFGKWSIGLVESTSTSKLTLARRINRDCQVCLRLK